MAPICQVKGKIMRRQSWYIALIGMVVSASALANPGEDGDQEFLAAATTVVNAYSRLTVAATAGATTITVPDVAELTLPGAACPTNACNTALELGDLLMIYQPQGVAAFATTNGVGYGAVSDLGSAGLYEFVYVQSIAGNVITVSTDVDGSACTGLRNNYTIGGAGVAPPMVIRVPQYRNLSVASAATLAAADWNWSSGSTGLGGVLVIDVRGLANPPNTTGNLVLNGTLTAAGRGFRGGVDESTGSFVISNNFVESITQAQKGESVAGGLPFYDANGGRNGRGAPANGGGGGNGINASGGGGANGGDPALWNNGRGVPDRTGSFDTAWGLEVALAATSVNTPGGTSDSGGGRGGYTWSTNDANAITQGPNNFAAWGGDGRREVGGLGGRPLNPAGGGQPYGRIFFGGGGGAGDANDNQAHAGGDGGGIVFVIARSITDVGSGAKLMTADGANGSSNVIAPPRDGTGGGGGGGTVVVTSSVSQPLLSTLNVSAIGGTGGSQTLFGFEAEGGGGGGGGGVVLVSTTSAVESVAGGSSGVTSSASLTEFQPNGGTAGAAGHVSFAPERDGASSPFICLTGPTFSNPVTNASFSSTRTDDGRVTARFSSASEVAHAGYFVYAQAPGGQRRRVSDFVSAESAASDAATSYEVSLNVAPADELYIADVSILGKETFRGPFTIGQSYGTPAVSSDYDWTTSRAELAATQAGSRGAGSSIAKVAVRTRGMQRVSYEQLLTAGVDLGGTAASAIAVIASHGPVTRRIRGPGTFGPGSSIEFFGDNKPSLWSRDTFYLVQVDPIRARDMGLETRAVTPVPIARQLTKLTYAPQNAYLESSPVGDPWFADTLISQGGLTVKNVSLTGPAPVASTGQLELVVWGGIDWPGATPDHSIRILLNGQQVASRRWDGLTTAAFSIPVSVNSTSNTVRIEVPGDTGYPADMLHLESVALTYEAAALGNGSKFYGTGIQGTPNETIFANGMGDATGEVIAGVISVGNVAGTELRAYRISGPSATEYAVSGPNPSFYSAGFAPESELWVAPAAQLISPTVSAAAMPDNLFGGPADWLAISHANFMGSALNDLAARRQQQGLTTRIVDVAEIYTRYSAGNPSPEAIQRYVREAKAAMGVDYVVLVGADTTDAAGYANSGSVSFVPTPYETTSVFVRYAPADPLIADVDGDRRPDLAIGRLPVRTVAEMQEAVRKILAYETQTVSNQVMLVAGPNDPESPQVFAAMSESLSAGLNASWNVDRVYQDNMGLNPSRLALVNGFNDGRSVISYIGHSGPTRWTFDPLLDITQVTGTSVDPNRPNLAASTNQPIVMQFACWTTYFVSATQNTMAQALLLTPNRGASAIVGATVLLDMNSHQRMSDAMKTRLISGARIGDVVQAAKVAIAADASQGTGPEVMLGQVLLGDPAQPIR